MKVPPAERTAAFEMASLILEELGTTAELVEVVRVSVKTYNMTTHLDFVVRLGSIGKPEVIREFVPIHPREPARMEDVRRLTASVRAQIRTKLDLRQRQFDELRKTVGLPDRRE